MNIPHTHIVLAAFALAATASTAIAEPARHFAFEASGGPMRQPHEFIVRIVDPATIDMARNILNGNEKNDTIIVGDVVKGRVDYNESWPFHLNPKSIHFAAGGLIDCDATTQHVNENLHRVGTDFLPTHEWCPWSARLTREVQYP